MTGGKNLVIDIDLFFPSMTFDMKKVVVKKVALKTNNVNST